MKNHSRYLKHDMVIQFQILGQSGFNWAYECMMATMKYIEII